MPNKNFEEILKVKKQNAKPAGKNKKTAGLGRGLNSLLGVPSPPQNNLDRLKQANLNAPVNSLEFNEKMPTNAGDRIWKLRIDHVSPNPDQPRKNFEEKALGELADSIKSKGLLQPITVKKLSEKSYQIIAGERRWRASQAAGLHEISAIIKDYSDQDISELALIE